MNLLFSAELEKLINQGELLPERKEKYQEWVSNSFRARSDQSLDPRLNQYDKAEELLTWYTFAPLFRMDPTQIESTINTIFNPITGASFESPIKLSIEKMLLPPQTYYEHIPNHPVKHIRDQITRHKNQNRRLEGHTHIDCYIETSNHIIAIEAKFTSDISHDVSYNPTRNQIARTIDVCLTEAQQNKKQVIFLLLAPQILDNRGRLYHHLMKEYQNPETLKQDLPHQESYIDTHFHSLHSIHWSEIVPVILTKSNEYGLLSPTETKDLETFYKERLIKIKSHLIRETSNLHE